MQLRYVCGCVCGTDDAFTEALRVNLQRLIVYAKSADTSLQREVAEKLANEAVKRADSVFCPRCLA